MHVLQSTDEAAAFAAARRQEHRRLVFVAGAFELLHPGHLAVLEMARRAGDLLVVGVTADRPVREAEGPGRPVVPASERAEILSALWCVDAVCLFDPRTADALLDALRPDVVVTGPECALGDHPLGAHVFHIERVDDSGRAGGAYSTCMLIHRIQALSAGRSS